MCDRPITITFDWYNSGAGISACPVGIQLESSGLCGFFRLNKADSGHGGGNIDGSLSEVLAVVLAVEVVDLLAEQASDVNILFHAAGEAGHFQSPDQDPGGCVIPEAVLRLRKLLADAGKTVTLRIC